MANAFYIALNKITLLTILAPKKSSFLKIKEAEVKGYILTY